MRSRIQTVLSLIGILAIFATGVSVLWHQPDVSGSSRLSEALASEEMAPEEVAQAHLDIAAKYEKEAEHREEQAQRFEKRASAITPAMDPKGFRREGMKLAADSQSSMASEFRFRAKVHRLEAELIMHKSTQVAKES